MQTNVLCREINVILEPLVSRKSQGFGNYLGQRAISWERWPARHDPEKTWTRAQYGSVASFRWKKKTHKYTWTSQLRNEMRFSFL